MAFTPEELRKYHIGFEVFDPCGKGRMRELIYDYRLSLMRDKSEIDRLKALSEDQAACIDSIIKMKLAPSREVELERDNLKKELDSANLTIVGLKEWAECLERILSEHGIDLPRNKWIEKESA